MEKLLLDGRWRFKEFVGLDWVWRDSEKPDTKDVRWWMDATVPGSVMNDLWQNGMIDDPYFELNSKRAEWASARTWVYRCAFQVTQAQLSRRARLCMDGVDYQCIVYLNGQKLGEHVGMYSPIVLELTGFLKEGENLLAVVIEPAPFEQPQVGRTSLTHTHKSRMTYWWDFCPRMVQQGIWQSVYIAFSGKACISDVHIASKVSKDLGRAEACVQVACDCAAGWMVSAEMDGQKQLAAVADGAAELRFEIENPRLWQTNGMGEPHEYKLCVRLEKDGRISDEREMLHGFKRVEWEHNPGREQNAPFLLRLNGKQIFIKGYNWVPEDVMYGAASAQKREALFALLKDAGVNLLRVWGGGLIETEAFYRLCAENGILVWQEFILSSSGIDNKTPGDPEFLAFMKADAKAAVTRLRNETALLVWCGGNELQADDGTPLTVADSLLGMLNEMIGREDAGRRFLATSPSGGVFMNSLDNIQKAPDRLCDVHGPWEHQGIMGHAALYNAGTCQLHSEFGVEGMANAYALDKTIQSAHQLPAGKDNPYYFHRGAWWINDGLLREMFGPLETVERTRRASQYSQYEGLKYALERDRSRWPVCGGAIPWQFNEPYPNAYCTANVDYYAQPKPAYYGVKRAYAPALPVARLEGGSLAGKKRLEAALSILHEDSLMKGYRFDCAVYNLRGQKVGEQAFEEENAQFVCDVPKDADFLLMRLTLTLGDGNVVRNEYLFTCGETYQGVLDAGHPCVNAIREGARLRLRNEGTELALFLTLCEQAPAQSGTWLRFSDGGFCLLPNEEREIDLSEETAAAMAVEGLNVPMQNF